MLDSPLVLMPGIIYNVSFTRFKAAALLGRFRHNLESMTLVKSLLSEYDLDEANLSRLSEDAKAGVQLFCEREGKSAIAEGLDNVVLAIEPNESLIKFPEGSTKSPECSQIVTVCRVVGITDDLKNVKLTIQALCRAVKVPEEAKYASETIVSVLWNEKPSLNNNQWGLSSCSQASYSS